MGLRFRKSFKVSPRVKLNLNKETKNIKIPELVCTILKRLPKKWILIHHPFLLMVALD